MGEAGKGGAEYQSSVDRVMLFIHMKWEQLTVQGDIVYIILMNGARSCEHSFPED